MIFRRVCSSDLSALVAYFEGLSTETKSRFGPHGFDPYTLTQICDGFHADWMPFIGLLESGEIIGYTLVKCGYIPHEVDRLTSYHFQMDSESDYTMAPSITDRYQSQGIGTKFYRFVEGELILRQARKIVLWGGVQQSNDRAVHFYRKLGFVELGGFEYHGWNIDMVKYL